MSKRILTAQQQKDLVVLDAVASCTFKSITYTKAFKEYALHEYLNSYCNAKEIFVSQGFDLDIIGHDIPDQCIHRWKRSGTTGTRGRSKKKVFPSLEAELAYVKAENAFLKQLRKEQNSYHKQNTRSSRNSKRSLP